MSKRVSKVRQRLLDRGWKPVHTDMSDWEHPELHYHWRTVDALRLEEERDQGDFQAMRILGDWNEREA
jgi:hypothetical protein